MAKQPRLNLKKSKLKFSVTVTLKKDVLDPQGKVVQNTLQTLGMDNLKSIRQGKYFEIELDDSDSKTAEKKVKICMGRYIIQPSDRKKKS